MGRMKFDVVDIEQEVGVSEIYDNQSAPNDTLVKCPNLKTNIYYLGDAVSALRHLITSNSTQ